MCTPIHTRVRLRPRERDAIRHGRLPHARTQAVPRTLAKSTSVARARARPLAENVRGRHFLRARNSRAAAAAAAAVARRCRCCMDPGWTWPNTQTHTHTSARTAVYILYVPRLCGMEEHVCVHWSQMSAIDSPCIYIKSVVWNCAMVKSQYYFCCPDPHYRGRLRTVLIAWNSIGGNR